MLTRSLTIDKVYDLLKYIVIEPTPDSTDKRMYKYPFVAAEALSSETREIVDMFFARFDPSKRLLVPAKPPIEVVEATSVIISPGANPEPAAAASTAAVVVPEKKPEEHEEPADAKKESSDEDVVVMEPGAPTIQVDSVTSVTCEPQAEDKFELLEFLLSFLNTKTELNPVLAGYVAKTMQALHNRRKNDLLGYLLRFRPHLDNLIAASYSQSLADVLAVILRSEDDESKDPHAKDKKECVETIVKKMLTEKENEERVTAFGHVLSLLAKTSPSTAQFTGEPFVDSFYRLALSGPDLALRAGLGFIVDLVKLKTDPALAMQPLNEAALIVRLQQRCGLISNHYNKLTMAVVSEQTEETKHKEVDCSQVVRLGIVYLPDFKRRLEDSTQVPPASHDDF